MFYKVVIRNYLVIILTTCVISACDSINADILNKDKPFCFASFCFNFDSIDKLFTEEKFIGKYGRGNSTGNKFKTYCYNEQNLYLKFTPYHGENRQIMSIYVSKEKSCQHSLPPIVSFGEMKTNNGIVIGDTKENVLIYSGDPDFIKKTHNRPNEFIFIYTSIKNELLQTRIYIASNIVTAIEITVLP